MKKLFLIISLVVLLILSLVFFIVRRNVKTDKVYIEGTYMTFNQLKSDSSAAIQEDITLSEDNIAKYIKSELYALKHTRRTGNWNLKNDTLTITYQNEWLQLLEKKEHEGGFRYDKTNDSIVTKTEPFSIKYIVEKKNAPYIRLCPITKGQCFEKYMIEFYE